MSVTDAQARWLVYILHQGAEAKLSDGISKALQERGVITKRPGETTWSLTPQGYEIAKIHEAGGVSGASRPQPIWKLRPKPEPGKYVPTDVELKAVVKFLRGEPGQTGVKQEALDWVSDLVQRVIANRVKMKIERQKKKKAKAGANA